MAEIHQFEARLIRLRDVAGLEEPNWQALRFGVEELRIASFAEPLGTRGKVSPKRLDRAFLELERRLGVV
jgi:ATP-dependent helicase HrpA